MIIINSDIKTHFRLNIKKYALCTSSEIYISLEWYVSKYVNRFELYLVWNKLIFNRTFLLGYIYLGKIIFLNVYKYRDKKWFEKSVLMWSCIVVLAVWPERGGAFHSCDNTQKGSLGFIWCIHAHFVEKYCWWHQFCIHGALHEQLRKRNIREWKSSNLLGSKE